MTDVTFTVSDQVMWVVLEGEETMNSLTPHTIAELDEALAVAEKDRSLRAVVIRGAGEKAFCVGMDITFLGDCFADPDGVFIPILRSYHATLRRIEALGVPVIAQVDGLARAGGFELILACDVVIVADDAKVGDVHVSFGVPPGAGASARAARKLGDQRAKALMLTPTWLDGPTMVQWGLALSSHPRPDLDQAVADFVGSMRGQSRPVMAMTKHLISSARQLSFQDGLDLELATFERALRELPDIAEGYRAFVERRPASWGDADIEGLV
jgi:enoyl-CoA hydratase/carnithine racemase